ncbi:Carbon storage regulator [Sporomusa ovata DSM 2662]|uniref:Translational regulator CsrA n=1 Tax=Sporomusa ovata TaxID=2378 RepID=A0A0U1KUT3_9FIRM|nr:carbon storage regulator CsrA [Sporomusa ovata]EQB26374.1 carbon storage regulator [Sporomusa ovata DSM 2662]CQR70454.1 Carbon storage regulator [Sporomusa ovata]
MLVLTRKIGEKVIIDNNTILTIVDVKGDSVRIGIEAPKEITIYRGELYEAIVTANKQSVQPVNLDKLDLLKSVKLP